MTIKRQDLYAKHAEQAWKDLQASSDDFDRNLLTFSSAALGLSLSFVKDFVPLKSAVYKPCLYGSWIAFASCILVTIFSFPISLQAQKAHVKHLQKYYLDNDPAYLDKPSLWSRGVTACSVLGGIFFLAGLAGTVIFAIENAMRIH